MGAVLGLLFGGGLILLLTVGTSKAVPPRHRLSGETRRALALTAGTGCGVLLAALALSQNLPVSVALAGAAAVIPWTRRHSAERKRLAEIRAAWPDLVDDLASAVRAGLPLTEALVAAGTRAPESMRPAFKRFAARVRLTGRVDEALTALNVELADPIASRVIDSIRLTRDVGGVDLGRVLRTLSIFLRDDARLRGEVLARQSSTVNSARLAVAAPWVVLAMLSMRPSAVAAYKSVTGVAILLVVGVLSIVAYWLMLRLGRLPDPTDPS